MIAKKNLPIFIILIFSLGATPARKQDARFLSYITTPGEITFYWKDDKGQIFRSIQNLKTFVENNGSELKFAMNGGMYKKDNSPQGLYIENETTLAPIDTFSGGGNFYMKPNGIFYVTSDNKAVVCTTPSFEDNKGVKFATQSGPMLLIDGNIHPAFKEGSNNVHIRNGVGILPDGRVVFAISKQEVNFYDFAMFFKNLNCKNALYLDGFVSRVWLPDENRKQLDGNFGVIIGVVK